MRKISPPPGFDPRTVQSVENRYIDWTIPAHNINEYQEYFLGGKGGRCVGLTTLPSSCADCLEIWESQTSWTLRACPGIALPLPLPSLFFYNFYCFLFTDLLHIFCPLFSELYQDLLTKIFTVEFRPCESRRAVPKLGYPGVAGLSAQHCRNYRFG
jgi:hypothetical protein